MARCGELHSRERGRGTPPNRSVTPSDHDAALAALGQGRAIYGRLDQIRSPEDTAADIIDLWNSAESAMRAVLGGSVLSGQPLVRELRQRGVIDLGQANTLAAFWDIRSKVDDVNYKPTLTDVGAVRGAYSELTKVAESGPSVSASAPSVAQQPQTAPPPPEVLVHDHSPKMGRLSMPAVIGTVVGVLLVVGIVAYVIFGRSSYDSQMAGAIDLMRGGQTEAARARFSAIAIDNPNRAEPHVFLARLSRTDADMTTAHQQLETAIRLDPNNALAQREMGLLLLSQNNAELASHFLIRAARLAPTDSAAQGYLVCALMQLHRVEEAQSFLARIGSGPWSSCATPLTPSPGALLPASPRPPSR